MKTKIMAETEKKNQWVIPPIVIYKSIHAQSGISFFSFSTSHFFIKER